MKNITILTGDLFYKCGTTRQGNRHITYYYAHTVNGRDVVLKPLTRLPDNEDGKKQWLIHYLPSMTAEYNFIYSNNELERIYGVKHGGDRSKSSNGTFAMDIAEW